LKSFGLDIVIGATIGSAVSAIKTVSNSANALGSTIKKLENRKIDIIANDNSINRYKKAIQSAENEIDKLRKKQQFLREKISMTTDKSKIKELRNELNKVSTTIKKISNQKLNLKEKLQNTENEVKNTNKEFIKLGKTIDSINKHKINIQTNIDKRNNFKSKLFDTAALGTTIALPFKAGIEFESSMARVKALSGATNEQFKQLEATAKKLGATTTFSASQSAEAMQFLAMAGFKTNDITKAMPGLLDLAAAGQTDLATTADITSNILSGFGISADKTTHVADVMAKAMTSANVDTQMLGETMKYVAPAAAGLGASLEEVTTLTAKLGDVGIQASSAGTALRSMYVRMASPPKEAQKAIQALGLTTKDSNGKFVGMINIIKQLQQKTKGLSDTQVAGLMKHLFGVEAMSGAIALMKVPAKELDKYEKSLKNADGTAKKIAKTQNDTVAGSFKALGSALEGVSIAFSSLFLPAIQGITTTITKATSGLNSFIENHKILAKVIGGVVGGIVAFTVVTTVLGYAWTFVSSAFSKASLALTWLKTNLTLTSIQTKLATFWTNSLNTRTKSAILSTRLWSATTFILSKSMGVLGNSLKFVAKSALPLTALALVAGYIYENWSSISAFFKGVFKGIKNSFLGVVAPIKGVFKSLETAIQPLMSAFSPLINIFKIIGQGVMFVINKISEFFAPINATKEELNKLSQTGENVGNIIGNIFGGLFSIITIPIVAGVKIITFALNTILHPIDTIKNGFNVLSEYFSGFWIAIQNKFNIGVTFISNVFVSPISYISNVWSRLVAWFNSFWGSLGAGFSKGVSFISNVFVSPINTIKKLWGKLIGWIKSKIEWISNTAKKIKSFFSFGSDDKEKSATQTKSSVTKKVIASSAIAAHVTTATPIIKQPIIPTNTITQHNISVPQPIIKQPNVITRPIVKTQHNVSVPQPIVKPTPVPQPIIKQPNVITQPIVKTQPSVTVPQQKLQTQSIKQIQNQTKVQKNENIQTSQAQTIMYQFHFGDIKIEAKDGKIDEHSLKSQIEDVLKEIDFEHKQRSLEDVM